MIVILLSFWDSAYFQGQAVSFLGKVNKTTGKPFAIESYVFLFPMVFPLRG